MGRIAAALFTTVDGSAERPDQWHGPSSDEAMGRAMDRHTSRCAAYLMGRVLYEQWAQYWPGNDSDPFADFINPIPKHVLSSTLRQADWAGTTVLPDLDAVRALRERTEGTIGMSGSLRTVRALVEAGLLDELEALPTGVLHLVYRPAAQG